MKQAGTYAGYLHTEIMRVVPTYVVLSVVVLLVAVLIARAKFPAYLTSSAAGRRRRLGQLPRAVALSLIFLLAVVRAVCLRGRAGGHVVEH